LWDALYPRTYIKLNHNNIFKLLFYKLNMKRQVQVFRARANLEERAKLTVQLRINADEYATRRDRKRIEAYYTIQALRANRYR